MHMLTVILTFLLLPFVADDALAQAGDRLYLDAVLEQTSKSKAVYYRELAGREGDLYLARTYTLNGELKAEGTYADEKLLVEHGQFIFYHANGKLESRGAYHMGLKTGVWLRYDRWGRDLAEKVYDHEPLDNILYTRAETMPSYPGGEKEMVHYLRKEVVGEERVRRSVTASFVVEKDGTLTEVKVLEGMGEPFDSKLVHALESTQWEAGAQKGVPVRVQMRVPVDF